QHETQPDPSPRPSPTFLVSIPEGSSGNHGGQSSSDRSLSGNEDGMTLQSVYDLCVSLCKQCLYEAKIGIKEIIEEKLDAKGVYEGKTSSVVLEEKENADKEVSTEAPFSTVKPNEGTDKRNEGTDKQDGGSDSTKVSTDKQGKGTANQNEVKSATQTALTTTSTPSPKTATLTTPTPTNFGDDETIAQVLIIMSQNKEKLKEKEKGVKLKDVDEIKRPSPTLTRSLLTLKPLSKIDPKDKGKKMIEEEDESDTESDDITFIYMLVERRYPLSKELLQRMLDLGLEVKEESTAALQLSIH
ncbi:hypothetical protein Tco_0602008, partial [Tanacetum coccineum]